MDEPISVVGVAYDARVDAKLYETDPNAVRVAVRNATVFAIVKADIISLMRGHVAELAELGKPTSRPVQLTLKERKDMARLARNMVQLTRSIIDSMRPVIQSIVLSVLILRVLLESKKDDPLAAVRAHIMHRFMDVLPGMFIDQYERPPLKRSKEEAEAHPEAEEAKPRVVSRIVGMPAGYIIPPIYKEDIKEEQWGIVRFVNVYKQALSCAVVGLRVGNVFTNYLTMKQMQNKSIPADVARAFKAFDFTLGPFIANDSIRLNSHGQVLEDQVRHILVTVRNIPRAQYALSTPAAVADSVILATCSQLAQSLGGGAPPHPAEREQLVEEEVNPADRARLAEIVATIPDNEGKLIRMGDADVVADSEAMDDDDDAEDEAMDADD